jgi:hypothetical protein
LDPCGEAWVQAPTIVTTTTSNAIVALGSSLPIFAATTALSAFLDAATLPALLATRAFGRLRRLRRCSLHIVILIVMLSIIHSSCHRSRIVETIIKSNGITLLISGVISRIFGMVPWSRFMQKLVIGIVTGL